jgi:hypothetical protein
MTTELDPAHFQPCGHPHYYRVKDEEGSDFCKACHDQANETVFVRQPALAQGASGRLYQLWQCRVTGLMEWREVPLLTDIRKEYPGRVINRPVGA